MHLNVQEIEETRGSPAELFVCQCASFGFLKTLLELNRALSEAECVSIMPANRDIIDSFGCGKTRRSKCQHNSCSYALTL